METKQGKKESPRTGGWISALKFLPLVVFAALVIVFKLELLLAAPIAHIVAILVYIFIYRGNFDGAFEQGLKSARSIIGVFFHPDVCLCSGGELHCHWCRRISHQPGAEAGCYRPDGGSHLSGGNQSAFGGYRDLLGNLCGLRPDFLWLSELVGGDPMLTVCAIAGGSCFGDNIGMISDVTVLSCGMQDVRIIDRVKHQSVWSCGCLVLAAVVIFSVQPPSAQCPGGRG